MAEKKISMTRKANADSTKNSTNNQQNSLDTGKLSRPYNPFAQPDPEYKELTAEEERECIIAAKRGDRAAIDKLIKDNRFRIHGLALKMMQKFAGQTIIEVDDLEQSAVEKILDLKAIKRFDPNKNFRFFTYAAYDMRTAMIATLKEFSTFGKIKRSVWESVRKVKNIIEELSCETPEKAIEYGLKRGKLSNNDCRRYKEYCRIKNPVPLYADYITITPSYNHIEEVEEHKLAQKQVIVLKKSMEKNLSERQSRVLKMHFGMDVKKQYSLAEIAKKENISKSRAQQIKNEAEAKLAKDPELQRCR